MFKRKKKLDEKEMQMVWESTELTQEGIEMYLYIDDIIRGKEVDADPEIELLIYEMAREIGKTVAETREKLWGILDALYQRRLQQ